MNAVPEEIFIRVLALVQRDVRRDARHRDVGEAEARRIRYQSVHHRKNIEPCNVRAARLQLQSNTFEPRTEACCRVSCKPDEKRGWDSRLRLQGCGKRAYGRRNADIRHTVPEQEVTRSGSTEAVNELMADRSNPSAQDRVAERRVTQTDHKGVPDVVTAHLH